METRTDGELIGAYVDACDDNAFAELVSRHQRMVYRVCLRMLGHQQEAEDATQAVFIVLLNKGHRLTRKGELTGWLYGVSRNVALEALRKRARRQEEVAMQDEPEAPPVECGTDHEAALNSLDEELAGLSGVLRQAVVLRYLQGYDQAEAARQVGCSVGTLSSRSTRGIEQLRQRLTKRGVALSGVALAGLLTSEASAAIPETLLPSILATVKSVAATGAAATALPGVALGAKTGTTTAAMLAKGAMKAMFIAKVKMVAAVVAVVVMMAGGAGVTTYVALAGEQSKPRQAESPKPVADGNAKTAAGKTGTKDDVAGGEVVKNLQLVLSVAKVESGPRKPKFTADMIECVPGEPLQISFTVAVVNRGTTPLKIMNSWYLGNFLGLVAPAGREIEEIKDYPFLRGSIAVPEDVKELAPGEKITYTNRLNVTWDPKDKKHPGKALIFYDGGGTALDISKPGTYRVIADFQSDDWGRRIAKERKLDIWNGKIRSNVVRLDVQVPLNNAETTKLDQVTADLKVLNTALQEHFVMRGNYPDAKTWTTSAITNGLPKSFTFRDPWGEPYVYSNTTANSYTLFSTGAKREQGRRAEVEQTPR